MRPRDGKHGPWALSGPDRGENSGDGAYRLIGFEWNGARLWVRLASSICGDWLAFRMPDLQIETLPPHFVDAAWDAMIQDALTGLGIAGLCPGMRVLGGQLPDGQWTYPHGWTLSIRSPDTVRSLRAELAVDDAGLQCLGHLLERMPPPDNAGVPAFLDALPILLVAQAGETTLQAADVRGLQPGDVVLFDRRLADLDGDVWLATANGQGLRVRACEPGASRYVVIQEWSCIVMNENRPPESDYAPEENHLPVHGGYPSEQHDAAAMQDYRAREDGFPPGLDDFSPQAPADEGRAAGTPASETPARMAAGHEGPDVDRIPVQLGFDLGEHKMTLGELRRLRPGEFFDLQRPIDAGPVHIRANGTLIGTAELVDIDGRIGARVLTLIPGRDSWG
ncbi:hypothetical protein AKI39_19310 [Bordetella sp. H567]|nr:hypothetical protein AKI39_19310 [Bordetella sp. H567]